MTVAQFLDLLKQVIEEIAPTLALMLWNYDQSKISEAKMETQKVKTELQLELNHEKIDQDNYSKSDDDIVTDAINNRLGGNGQS